jgi:putative membrane protein
VRLLDVPLVIPLAWTMMAYPALVVGRVVADRWQLPTLGRIVVSALALATWDVFLDPQMVDAGHWIFASDNGPTLTGIPLLNFAGWLVVALLLMGALTAAMPSPGRDTDDRVPLALYLWTYGSSVLANLAFFDRQAVALTGGLAMGVPVALLLVALRRRRA